MKAVIYARYSSDSQREESIEGQLRECREYANRNEIQVIDTYIDRALTATKDIEKRLEFQRMILDSAKGLFDLVIVWKLDRFSRNRYDSAHYKNILNKNGVKVVSATEGITDGPEGIILESLLEGMAEYYSAELSAKIHRGQKENALKGKSNGGGVPLGYLIGEQQQLEVDPITAPIVLEIFQRYAEGETISSIRDSLNQRGLRTRTKKPFSISSFGSVLKNRKYIGEYSYRDVMIPGGVPAIVPEELFHRVQERMKKNKRAPARGKAAEAFLLTTKLFCGKCGCMMVGESGTSRTGKSYYYYKCGNAKRKKGCDKRAVKKDWIEQLVVQQTAQMILDDDVMERLIDKLLEAQGKINPDVAVLQKRIAEAKCSIQNLLKAIEAGLYTSSTKQRLEELESEKCEAEKALIVAELKNPALTREAISFYIYRFRKLDITISKHRQRLIDSFVNAVYVFDDKLVLTYNYKDGTQTIPLDVINGSDLEASAPPSRQPFAVGFFMPCIAPHL